MEAFDMTSVSMPMPEEKATDRVFQFHGKECGSCDKTDDTTKTNTAELWKLNVWHQFDK